MHTSKYEDLGPSFRETRGLIRAGNHCLYVALAAIARFSQQLGASNKGFLVVDVPTPAGPHPCYVGQWHLAFIAKEIIFSSNDYRPNPLTGEQIAFYANQYTNIPDSDILISQSQTPAAPAVPAKTILFRIDQEQMTWQSFFPVAEIARTLEMYLHIPKLIPGFPLDFNNEFERVSGMGIETFLQIGFAAFARANRPTAQGFIAHSLVPRSKRPSVLTLDNVRRFLMRTSIAYRPLREQVAEEEAAVPGLEKYAFNPLQKTPIVVTDQIAKPEAEPVLFAPVPLLTIRRITDGVYWDLMDDWSERASLGPPAPDFPGLFGRAFEQYVGVLLADYLGQSRLFAEQSYGPARARRASCDWIAIDPNCTVLIECKTGRFHKRTKSTGDAEDIYDETRKTLAKALVQLVATRRALEQGEIRDINRVGRVFGMIVTIDHLLVSLEWVKQDMERAAMEIDQSITPAEIAELNYKVVPVKFLEQYASRIPKDGLYPILEKSTWDNIQTEADRAKLIPERLQSRWRQFTRDLVRVFEPPAS